MTARWEAATAGHGRIDISHYASAAGSEDRLAHLRSGSAACLTEDLFQLIACAERNSVTSWESSRSRSLQDSIKAMPVMGLASQV